MIDIIETIYDQPSERRIIDRDDWTDREWKTIMEIFGLKKEDDADRIVVRKYTAEKHIIDRVES